MLKIEITMKKSSYLKVNLYLVFVDKNLNLSSRQNSMYIENEQMSQQINNTCIYGYRLFYVY